MKHVAFINLLMYDPLKVPRHMRNAKGKSLPRFLVGERGECHRRLNVGEDRMNPGIEILLLPSANILFGGRISR